ncbi:MAG TPA: hypothetical protein VLQ66_02225 [Paenisporosarcina sp.]|nr:hypothetical protein [Paenisporosarcina sp.]
MSEDLVVKFASLVVKMEHLVVILADLVVKNIGLVVIVTLWNKKRRVSPTEKAFGGAKSSNRGLDIEKRAAKIVSSAAFLLYKVVMSSSNQLAGPFLGSERRFAFHPSSAGVELEGALRFS